MAPRSSRTSRILRYAAAAVVFVAVAAAIRHFYFSAPKPARFVTATATTMDLEDAVLATGTVQAFKQVSVGAQVSGQIKILHVKLGDTVKKGQPVAEIDSTTQQNNLRNAQAGLENVRAQLAAQQVALIQAELSYKRQKELLDADAGSRQDFEAAEATRNTTRANIGALQAQIRQASITAETAQVNLGYTKIASPIDGVVVALVAQQGQTVNANQTTPTIIKVAQLDTVTVKSQISEADVVKVQAGQPVYFTILGEPDRRYDAKLRTVEPAPDSILTDTTSSSSSGSTSTSTTAIYYNGLFDVPNPDGKLRISMTAQVSIVRAEAKGAVAIPSSALGRRERDGSYTVRVLDADGNAQPRKIKVGMNNNVNAQVTEGLVVGDKVVLGEAGAPGTGAGMPGGRRPPMRL
ncbi:efflux RND transporter periplasmic adaptor subunit [Xylophilus ampelinus]|uniref:Macrolide-specific efflux system membrane fusion protein n=1 Tax=Xylophilus ampelinus TaxID=54067 RepID=A0A318SK39_9BURK|nr:efflux RND transporter periplasmic adaptor subunit [Xylophilus ampelinus]MCS4511415.1 efflux RND transporter periplasmic adaptor subunit [Xylophilus ampelinus]PYE75842.1 macrolide-specific efflux system membrane fusion protein [Xylophilus ampelinus]